MVKGRSRGVGVDILWVDVREKKRRQRRSKMQVHLEGGGGGVEIYYDVILFFPEEVSRER